MESNISVEHIFQDEEELEEFLNDIWSSDSNISEEDEFDRKKRKKVIISAVINDIVNNEISLFNKSCKKRRNNNAKLRRIKKRRARWTIFKDYMTDTTWGKLINNPNVENPNSKEGKSFRRRFRIPFPLFKLIVQLCRKENIFEHTDQRKVRIPIEIQVLCALRILARDCCADTITEISNVGNSTVNTIFHKFVKNFSNKFKDTYIKPPEIGSIFMTQVQDCYDKLGFPGCIGSMDCTHIKWDQCPKENRSITKGKEGYPTLSFEVVVDHSRRIHSVSEGFNGTVNDKTISRYDKYCKKLEVEGIYKNVEYILYDKHGIPFRCKGLYLIVDGGYREALVYINPITDDFSYDVIIWNEILESVRKDIECTFGVIKGRFRFLRNGIVYHSASLIENAFITACILHNMLLVYDGLDLSNWEENVEWENLDPNHEEDIENINLNEEQVENHNNIQFPVPDVELINNQHIDLMQIQDLGHFNDVKVFYTHSLFRKALVDHFHYMYKIARICWPKNLKSWQAQKYGTSRTIVERISKELSRSLYANDSTLYSSINPNFPFGQGLFSHLKYKIGDIITAFKGEVINVEEANSRIENNMGEYIIYLNNNYYLDCRKHRLKYLCMASLANCPTGANIKGSNLPAQANCKIVIVNGTNLVKLIAKEDIEPHEELLWYYGDQFNIQNIVSRWQNGLQRI
jgi:hypothetical protein